MGDGRVVGRLCPRLGLLPIAIDVIVNGAVQAEGTELHGCAIDLVTVARHAHGLLLVEETALVARGASCGPLGGLDGASGETARRASRGLVLLGSRQRCSRGASRGRIRVPRVRSLAADRLGFGRMGCINDVFKIILGETISGRGERRFRLYGYSDLRRRLVAGNLSRG